MTAKRWINDGNCWIIIIFNIIEVEIYSNHYPWCKWRTVFDFAFRKVEILVQAMPSTPEHQLYLLYSILNWKGGCFANPVYHVCFLITIEFERLIVCLCVVLEQLSPTLDLVLSTYLIFGSLDEFLSISRRMAIPINIFKVVITKTVVLIYQHVCYSSQLLNIMYTDL